ncbi:MAG TPA: ATP-binding protein [Isosphaeraceae bacterium]|jgi:PAS domain S-box-containing protein|nr:ATP-binding protein [Isosphaeraceae bacterium]
MDLEQFSRQLELIHARFLELSPRPGRRPGHEDSFHLWRETSAALSTTMEELRVAEEELRQQGDELVVSRDAVERERYRYRGLFNDAPDAFLVTDLHGIIREANDFAVELLGVPASHLPGKPLANFVAREARSTFRLEVFALKEAGRRRELTLTLEPRRRPAFEVTMSVAVLRDAYGTPTGLFWTIREVGDEATRRLAADLARERRARERAEDEARSLRELLLGMPALAWEADATTGRRRLTLPAGQPALGHPAERWREAHDLLATCLHPDDREVVEHQWRRCLLGGEGREHEYRVVAADGRIRWFREVVRVVLDEDGRPRLLRGLMWDITRRKRVERGLYTARRELADELAETVYLQQLLGRLAAATGPEAALAEVLTAVAGLLGAPRGEARRLDPGRGELDLLAAIDLPEPYRDRFHRLPVGHGPAGLAIERRALVVVEDVAAGAEAEPDDAERSRLGGYRAAVAVPLPGADGAPIGTVTVFFDEPHRPDPRPARFVEVYASMAAPFLDRALRPPRDDARDEFLAILAHELRSPLGAIRNAAELLDPEGLDGATVAELREMIRRQVGYMGRLIEDLLDAARLARGTLGLRTEPVDLAAVVGHAVEDVTPLVRDRGHELIVALPEGPCVVEADPTRLEQVLSNLLVNAAKYTPPGGRIELSATLEADGLTLRVRDTGVGMSPEALARAFDLFDQADDPGAVGARNGDAARRGLGIGLALVKSLVELHGGTVSAHSAGPGQGSEFVVRLPAAAPQEALTDHEKAESLPIPPPTPNTSDDISI